MENGMDRELEVNVNELDKEWVRQPGLFFRYASMLADARQELEAAKGDFELAKAEADQEVRTNPQSYGISKVTEGAISAVVPTLEACRKARDRVSKAKHQVDVLEAMVGALEHKKKALERLVELFLAGYFSVPISVPKTEAGGDREEAEKRLLRRGRERRME